MAEKAKQQPETAPDPDEDDLDDLDDVLDSFDAKPKSTTTATPAASGPGRPTTTSSESAIADDVPATTESEEDMQKQLEAGIGGLISQLGDNPDMQKQFEDMMQELLAAGAAPTDSEAAEHVRKASDNMPVHPDEKVKAGASSSGGGAGGKKEDNFQDTIRKTMERMQQSGDAATAASSSGSGGAGAGASEEAMFMEMMKSLGGGEGMGGEEDFNTMLMSMMTQLTNKEILYEPMKELHDKFPPWMEANADKTPAEELEKYQLQQRLVGEIVGRFESPGYSDGNEDDREYIVERMQKMQAAGSPPQELVGDMSAAQEALGDLDSGCPTQ